MIQPTASKSIAQARPLVSITHSTPARLDRATYLGGTVPLKAFWPKSNMPSSAVSAEKSDGRFPEKEFIKALKVTVSLDSTPTDDGMVPLILLLFTELQHRIQSLLRLKVANSMGIQRCLQSSSDLGH